MRHLVGRKKDPEVEFFQVPGEECVHPIDVFQFHWPQPFRLRLVGEFVCFHHPGHGHFEKPMLTSFRGFNDRCWYRADETGTGKTVPAV